MSDPHALGVTLPKWGEPLLAAKFYTDAKQLAELIVLRRALDPGAFEAAQKYWVTACIRQATAQTPPSKAAWREALPHAKGYYNAAALPNSAEAANLLAQVLAQVKDTATAAAFLNQQATADASSPTSRPSEILKSIQCDKTHFDFAIQFLKGRVGASGESYSSLMSRGDYYLVDDQPAEARKCFEGACRVAGNNAKQVREAVEGVARAMRAQDGNVAHANAFIESLREDPAQLGTALMDSGPTSPQASDLQAAAAAVKLADMTKLDAAPAATTTPSPAAQTPANPGAAKSAASPDEDSAKTMLSQAKLLIANKQKELATKKLKDLIEHYPKTDAADEATALLSQLNSGQ
jgi:hypothetical protein